MTLYVNGLDYLSILIIALGLSADCFAVSISAGIAIKNPSKIQITRVALSFGLFQALMPVLGWVAGRAVFQFISSFDHWLAFSLLAFIGGKMLWESFRGEEKNETPAGVIGRATLLTLSIATSIDALAVGLSFAFLDVSIMRASLTIGVVAALVTVAGFLIGNRMGKALGKWAEIIGGLVLIGIGLKILLEHIL